MEENRNKNSDEVIIDNSNIQPPEVQQGPESYDYDNRARGRGSNGMLTMVVGIIIAVALLIFLPILIFALISGGDGGRLELNHQHLYGAWQTVTKPTCTTEGVRVRYCKCGENQTDAIKVTSHSYGSWVVLTPATCSSVGEKMHECVCGETEKVETPFNQRHNLAHYGHVDPTCTTPGGDNFSICLDCDKIIESGVLIPPTGHTLSDPIFDSSPADGQNGRCYRICLVCNLVFEEQNNPYNSLTYSVNPDGKSCTITGVTDDSTDIYIPGEINGLTVTAIGDDAFKFKSQIENVSIPDTVEYIGEKAFYNCYKIKELVIPDSVREIGKSALYNCNKLEKLTIPFVGSHADGSGAGHLGYIFGTSAYQNNNEVVPYTLKSIVVTRGEAIPDYAFYDCDYVESISLPDSVTAIGESAFYGCYALTEMIIPDGVTAINDHTFSCCYQLAEIDIPDGVQSIGEGAFYGCDALTEVIIPDGVTTISRFAFGYCNTLTKINIHEGVTVIEDYAFSHCPLLSNISLHDGITYIGKEAFSYCPALTRIIIPGGVTTISKSCFKGCIALSSVVINEGVSVIEQEAFAECTAIEYIELPSTITSIGYYNFPYCENVLYVLFAGSEEQWNSIEIDDYNSYLTGATIIFNFDPSNIPNY